MCVHAHKSIYNMRYNIHFLYYSLIFFFLPENHILNLEINRAGKIIVSKVYLGSLETMKWDIRRRINNKVNLSYSEFRKLQGD